MNKIAEWTGNPFEWIGKLFERMNKIVQQIGKPFKHDWYTVSKIIIPNRPDNVYPIL